MELANMQNSLRDCGRDSRNSHEWSHTLVMA
jgi:hypothetical protein